MHAARGIGATAKAEPNRLDHHIETENMMKGISCFAVAMAMAALAEDRIARAASLQAPDHMARAQGGDCLEKSFRFPVV